MSNKKIEKIQFPRTLEEALKHEYKFWDTQPVPKMKDHMRDDGEIISLSTSALNSTEPVNLPPNFSWEALDLKNDTVLKRVCEFVNENNMDNVSAEFKLEYEPEFIKRMLINDKYTSDMSLGIKYNNKIIGCIISSVSKSQVNRKILDTVEVNVLCVHPLFRNKRMCPILIRELSRRMQLLGYNYGLYNADVYLPKPFTTVQRYQRPINIKKLIETGYTQIPSESKIKMEDIEKSIKLAKNPTNKTFKPMELKHVDESYDLFNSYMNKFNVHPIYTKEEFTNLFINNPYVVCYVIEDNNGNPTDFISYYIMKYKVLKRTKGYEYINKGYLYYYTSMNETPYRLIKDMLVVANNNNIDVFNALELMENDVILRDLNFDQGSSMHYYFYNWRCRQFNNSQICKIII